MAMLSGSSDFKEEFSCFTSGHFITLTRQVGDIFRIKLLSQSRFNVAMWQCGNVAICDVQSAKKGLIT